MSTTSSQEQEPPDSTTVASDNESLRDPEGRTADGVYHVNTRTGHVAAHGEDLFGREILARAGYTADKYELFPLIAGAAGPEIPPEVRHRVKPGDHYRATIRGTDYSAPMRSRA